MKNIDYEVLRKKARESIYLYHYTNRKALEHIKKNESLRLSNLVNVGINDEMESERITSIWRNKIYVVCFTSTLDNQEYFIKEYGASHRLRIKIDTLDVNNLYFDPECTKKIDKIERSDTNYKNNINKIDRYVLKEDWGYRTSELLQVEYVDEILEYNGEDGHESNAGIIKQRYGKWRNGKQANWEQEKETRIRVALRPKYIENYRNGIDFITPMPIEAAGIEYIYLSLKNVTYYIEEI